jgi:indole-3-glycerol phosphate synthase
MTTARPVAPVRRLGVGPDLLEAIVQATRHAVGAAERRRSRAQLEQAAATRSPRGEAFRVALQSTNHLPIIAECKRRSPSRGVLRHDYHPAAIACAYEDAGASAISVLTEPAFFDGGLDHLEATREAVAVPILRKDFIVSEYQLAEALVAGADAALLIVAALDDATLRRLVVQARQYGLAALVEVHDTAELSRALAANAQIIGVNNRNLRTLDVNLEASFQLIASIPEDVVAVAESGIKTPDDLRALRKVGYDGFLVGESLVTRSDPGAALTGLLTGVETTPRGTR